MSSKNSFGHVTGLGFPSEWPYDSLHLILFSLQNGAAAAFEKPAAAHKEADFKCQVPDVGPNTFSAIALS